MKDLEQLKKEYQESLKISEQLKVQIELLENDISNRDANRLLKESLSFNGLIFESESDDDDVPEIIDFKFYLSYPTMPADQRYHSGYLYLKDGRVKDLTIYFDFGNMTISEGEFVSRSKTVYDSRHLSLSYRVDEQLTAESFEYMLRSILENTTFKPMCENYHS